MRTPQSMADNLPCWLLRWWAVPRLSFVFLNHLLYLSTRYEHLKLPTFSRQPAVADNLSPETDEEESRITCTMRGGAMKLRADRKHGKTFRMVQMTQMTPESATASARKEGGERSSRGSAIPGWREYVNAFLAAEISALTRYYDRVIQWLPRESDTGRLLEAIDAPRKETVGKDEPFPDLTHERQKRTAILINGTFNHDFDIQALLMQLKAKLARTSRLVVVLYNPYLRWAYYLTNRMGIRTGELPSTFVTRVDLENIAKVAGFEIVRQRPAVYCPWRMLGLGTAINRVMPLMPLARWLSLTSVVVMRPLVPSSRQGVSCVIPARNEKGNIENALKRFPDLGRESEIIFVEGHSTDGTWEEILRVSTAYRDQFRILAVQQPGKGKADAVRLGFSHAREDLLVILDGDLTMPPEMLSRFSYAYDQGHGDFINGSRLVYPMEGAAMRFLNRLGNIFFAKMLSAVLDVRLGDSLCGTKLVTRHDYERMVAWRKDFGEFDPFGDFELLFPAAELGLEIVDVPVRYLARTYGETNIQRFRHGLLLLKMTWVGLVRIKMGIRKKRPSGSESATRQV
jgi:glycosyl transferase family 2